MGTRDFDHDAERIASAVAKTTQMSGGFREMAKELTPGPVKPSPTPQPEATNGLANADPG